MKNIHTRQGFIFAKLVKNVNPFFPSRKRPDNHWLILEVSFDATSWGDIMTTPNKKRIYQAAAIAVTAEAIIGLSLILIPDMTVYEKLKIFGGI